MMSERAHSIIFAVLWGAAVVFGTMVLVTAVWAHDKHHPELSDWFDRLPIRRVRHAATAVMPRALKM